jgi:hypothetical protein
MEGRYKALFDGSLKYRRSGSFAHVHEREFLATIININVCDE